MTDASRLTSLLDDYAAALAGHLLTVREDFGLLNQAWNGLSDVYAGSGAEQFRDVFEASAERMRAYEHDAAGLLGVLRNSIEFLRGFDAPEPGL